MRSSGWEISGRELPITISERISAPAMYMQDLNVATAGRSFTVQVAVLLMRSMRQAVSEEYMKQAANCFVSA